MAKTITLILHRADREAWDGGPTTLEVKDLSQKKTLKPHKLAAGSHLIEVNLDLPFNAGQVYVISVDAGGHRAAWQLFKRRSFLREQGGVRIEVDDLIMRLMLIPNKPTSSDLDAGYEKLRSAGSPMVDEKTGFGRKAFQELDHAAKMAFLNIDAKLRETRLRGISLLSFVEGVAGVKSDRLYVFTRPELRQLVKDSADFADAPGHKTIPKDIPTVLPGHPRSWKHTLFGAGNVQLSYSEKTMPLPQDKTKAVFSVDVDIDLEQGLNHMGEWLQNKFSSKKTDQTLVYALLFAQGITPAYALDPVKPV
jgi:hypothetical protein